MVVLLQAVTRLLALPVEVSYTLPEMLEALGSSFPYRRRDYYHFPLGHALRAEALHASWYRGQKANLAEIGLSRLQAIQSATTVAAEMLRLEKSTGAVELGLEADLIVVDGNPLENLRPLQDPLLVVSNGRVALNRLDFAKGN